VRRALWLPQVDVEGRTVEISATGPRDRERPKTRALLPEPDRARPGLLENARRPTAGTGRRGQRLGVEPHVPRRFQRDDHFLFNSLDDGIAAKGVVRVLGDDLDEFYQQLWTSANGLDHFDTMVSFDNVLQRPGEVAEWAGQFQELTENWIENAGDDTSAQYYDKISEHLDLGDFSRLPEFEEAAAQAAEDEREPDDDEDGWSRSPQGEAPAIDYEGREIDTLFATLADAPSRPT
jgi:hypothetical protein